MKKIKIYFIALIYIVLMQAGAQAQVQAEIPVKITEGCGDDLSLKKMMETNTAILLSAFNRAVNENRQPEFPDTLMTEEARITFGKLWDTSPMLCRESQIDVPCRISLSGDYQIRDIPVAMLAANEETQNERIAVSFNPAGQISDIHITVETGNIFKIGKFTPDDVVNINKILDFIEKFRTAYNCKDIKYLENVYSDNALIINPVIKSIRQVPNSDNMIKSINDPKFDYNYQVRTKAQYLTRLKWIFKRNAYLNIMFDPIEVKAHPTKRNIYDVTLRQQLRSSMYYDVGVLYLLIDCSDKDEMKIPVRMWTPEKNEYFKE